MFGHYTGGNRKNPSEYMTPEKTFERGVERFDALRQILLRYRIDKIDAAEMERLVAELVGGRAG
jgi:hypothetical protein